MPFPNPDYSVGNDQVSLVLRIVSERDMDGYTLSKKSGLDSVDLSSAVRDLFVGGLLRVKGDLCGPRLMESWFQAV